jgi:glycerol uptake facilitator-like aquaporin
MEMAGIFSAYPQPQLSIVGALWDSTMGTMFLCILVHAINDKKNEKSCVFNNSMLVSIVIVIIICSYGYNGGAMINPARDLAPRLFTLIAGWGPRTFTTTHTGIENFWWIPVVGPLFGATFATLLYDICISNNWPAQ